jgi:hypothetical protein
LEGKPADNLNARVAVTKAVFHVPPYPEGHRGDRRSIPGTRGLRTPSETNLLCWSDVDYAAARLRVRSPKTERFAGHEQRFVPIVPRLMTLLEEWFELAPEGQEYLVTISSPSGRRRKMVALMDKAGVERWDDTWQTLRRSCEIEWALPSVCGEQVDRALHQRERSALRERDSGRTVRQGGRTSSGAACSRIGLHGAAKRKTGFGGRLAQRRHVPRVARRCDAVRERKEMEPGGIEPPGHITFFSQNKAFSCVRHTKRRKFRRITQTLPGLCRSRETSQTRPPDPSRCSPTSLLQPCDPYRCWSVSLDIAPP